MYTILNDLFNDNNIKCVNEYIKTTLLNSNNIDAKLQNLKIISIDNIDFC